MVQIEGAPMRRNGKILACFLAAVAAISVVSVEASGQSKIRKKISGRWLHYRDPIFRSLDPGKRGGSTMILDFTLVPSSRGPSNLVLFFDKGKGSRIKKISIPFSDPGGYLWRSKPRSLILCGWNENGRGKVLELELDFKGGLKDFASFEKEWDKKEKPTVSWSVEFKKRALDLAWGPFKGKIYILGSSAESVDRGGGPARSGAFALRTT